MPAHDFIKISKKYKFYDYIWVIVVNHKKVYYLVGMIQLNRIVKNKYFHSLLMTKVSPK